MANWSHLKYFRVMRLNATLFPVSEFETELYRKYNLSVVQVEAEKPGELIPQVADCDALFAISVALPKAVIKSLSRCRVISRLGTGTDKIDIAVASRKGIIVTNVPDFCTEEQAEHTMALLLALARKLPQMSQAMAEGTFSRARCQAKTNRRLSACTLGLIGFGNSARAVARRANGFGFRVIATRRKLNVPCREADELGVKIVSLDTLLAESDYVSLHLPLTAETYHLLNEAALRRMKVGAYLINTSRGSLVDEMALVKALREGWLNGAGLDTFEQIDPFTEIEAPPSHPLLTLDNVILTPHVAAASVQSARNVSLGGIQNMVSVLNGHWPPAGNIVNPDVVPRFPLIDYDASLFEATTTTAL